MNLLRAGGWCGIVLAAALLAGCGDDSDDTSGTALPDRPEDELIEESGEPERVVEGPTPETGTGGAIPGYDPGDAADGQDAPREETED